MTKEPYRINVRPYRDTDPKKMLRYQEDLRLAKVVGEYLTEKRTPGQPHTFLYHGIASALHEDVEAVERILRHMGGGQGGITI